jgi:DNA-binding GntR family transcriptional regulator
MLTLGELATQLSKRRSAPDLVAEVLREAILRGILRGGEPLPQDEVAVQLGVSRIPVREALRQLEAEGLVKFYPHRGVVVSELSAAEVEEIYDIRIPLECTALRLAVPHISAEDLRRAERILDAIDAETDIFRWSELNRDFHTVLYAPANRPRLMSLINTMRANVNRYMRLYISLLNFKPRSQEEHRRILAAVQRRDSRKAIAALERHLGTACRELVAYLSREPVAPAARAAPGRSG